MSDDLYTLFGLRLKQLQKQANLTQEELAAKIETSCRFVQQMEAGEHAPGFQTISLLSRCFDRPAKDLFDFEEMKNLKREAGPEEVTR